MSLDLIEALVDSATRRYYGKYRGVVADNNDTTSCGRLQVKVPAVLGGFGSLLGALVGGVLLGVVNALVGRYVSSNYQTVIAFGILLLLLAVRPQGIVGRHWEET